MTEHWKVSTVIKGLSESGTSWHSNIVGTLTTDEKEYVYKVSRLPSWKSFWEFLISNEIKTHLAGVKNFARVVDVRPLTLDVDEEGRTIPSTHSKVEHKRRERSVGIQKIILGMSLAKHIKCECRSVFSQLGAFCENDAI